MMISRSDHLVGFLVLSVLWSLHAPAVLTRSAATTLSGTVPSLITKETYVFTDHLGGITALSRSNGTEVWHLSGSHQFHLHGSDGAVVFLSDAQFCGLVACCAQSGKQLWAQPGSIGSPSGLVFSKDILGRRKTVTAQFSDVNGTTGRHALMQFDITTGRQVWSIRSVNNDVSKTHCSPDIIIARRELSALHDAPKPLTPSIPQKARDAPRSRFSQQSKKLRMEKEESRNGQLSQSTESSMSMATSPGFETLAISLSTGSVEWRTSTIYGSFLGCVEPPSYTTSSSSSTPSEGKRFSPRQHKASLEGQHPLAASANFLQRRSQQHKGSAPPELVLDTATTTPTGFVLIGDRLSHKTAVVVDVINGDVRLHLPEVLSVSGSQQINSPPPPSDFAQTIQNQFCFLRKELFHCYSLETGHLSWTRTMYRDDRFDQSDHHHHHQRQPDNSNGKSPREEHDHTTVFYSDDYVIFSHVFMFRESKNERKSTVPGGHGDPSVSTPKPSDGKKRDTAHVLVTIEYVNPSNGDVVQTEQRTIQIRFEADVDAPVTRPAAPSPITTAAPPFLPVAAVQVALLSPITSRLLIAAVDDVAFTTKTTHHFFVVEPNATTSQLTTGKAKRQSTNTVNGRQSNLQSESTHHGRVPEGKLAKEWITFIPTGRKARPYSSLPKTGPTLGRSRVQSRLPDLLWASSHVKLGSLNSMFAFSGSGSYPKSGAEHAFDSNQQHTNIVVDPTDDSVLILTEGKILKFSSLA